MDAEPGQKRPVGWQRLLIHLIFLLLVYYVAAESLERLFGDTPLAERGSRRSPLTLMTIVVAGTANWVFNLIYPVVPHADHAAPPDQAGR